MAADRAAGMANPAPAGSADELNWISPDQPETIPRASSPADAPAGTEQPQRPASPETLRLYAADWTAFEDWCGKQGLVPLPAGAASVAAFLAEGAATLSAGALTRRAAAIAAKHRRSGLPSPATDPAVTAILRVARRTAMPRRPPPKLPATLTPMAVRCPRDLAGLRDRALLLLAASGLGRAALVGLDVEHIRFTTTAAELSLDAASAGERAREEAGRGVPVVVGLAPTEPSVRCRRCVTGLTPPKPYSGRCFGKLTVGGRSNITGLAPTRSAGFWRVAARAAPPSRGRSLVVCARKGPDDPPPGRHGNASGGGQGDGGGRYPDGMAPHPTRGANG